MFTNTGEKSRGKGNRQGKILKCHSSRPRVPRPLPRKGNLNRALYTHWAEEVKLKSETTIARICGPNNREEEVQ